MQPDDFVDVVADLDGTPLDDVDTAAHTASGIEGRLITLLCETTLQSRSASCQDSVVSRPDSCWCKFQPWVVGAARTSAPWPPMELRASRPAPPPRLEAAICAGGAAVPESAALLPSCLCNTSPITEDPTSLGAQGRFHVHRVMRSTSTPPCACRVTVAESVHSRATTEDGQATPRATNGVFVVD